MDPCGKLDPSGKSPSRYRITSVVDLLLDIDLSMDSVIHQITTDPVVQLTFLVRSTGEFALGTHV